MVWFTAPCDGGRCGLCGRGRDPLPLQPGGRRAPLSLRTSIGRGCSSSLFLQHCGRGDAQGRSRMPSESHWGVRRAFSETGVGARGDAERASAIAWGSGRSFSKDFGSPFATSTCQQGAQKQCSGILNQLWRQGYLWLIWKRWDPF